MKSFWNWIRDSDNTERTLYLNGPIAEETWWGDEVTPKLFKDELFSGDGDITVWINSPGGDVFAAAQIYNMLMDYPDDVTVKVDGEAETYSAGMQIPEGATVQVVVTKQHYVSDNQTFTMVEDKTLSFTLTRRQYFLTINPTPSGATIAVTVNGDAAKEPTETFQLRLLAATGANLGATPATGTIINDD